jgi:hypothetical protein
VSATPAQMMYASKGVFPLLADVARGDGHLYGISCACQKTKSGKSGSGGGGGCLGRVACFERVGVDTGVVERFRP